MNYLVSIFVKMVHQHRHVMVRFRRKSSTHSQRIYIELIKTLLDAIETIRIL